MSAVNVEDQRRASLDRANEIRRFRADLKLDLANGHTTLAATLAKGDPRIATMRIRDLLLAVPGLGATKVRVALGANEMTPGTKIVALGDRRRDRLVRWLADHHPAVADAIGASEGEG